jgi:hypothetical protein
MMDGGWWSVVERWMVWELWLVIRGRWLVGEQWMVIGGRWSELATDRFA